MAASYAGGVSFVLGTDGVLDGGGRPWWHRLLFRPDHDGPSTTLGELSALTGRLAGAGHEVRVVDRRSGRSRQGAGR